MPATKILTIAIVSFKRPRLLSSCLKSIVQQKKHPNIIIIDNDYRKSAYKILKQFQNKLQLNYYCEPSKSISKARNLALVKCDTPYLAFIDDDCILSRDWSDHIYSFLKSKSNVAFFQGSVKNRKTNNQLINAQQKIYQNWINKNIKNNNDYNPEGLDTKNVVINLKLIKKHKIKFDTNLPIFEDCDFGLQLKKKRLKGKFIPKMSVQHKEISNLIDIVKKNFFRGKIKYVFNKKWHNYDSFCPNLVEEVKHAIKINQPIYQIIFNQSFNIGYLTAKKQRYEPNNNTIFIVNYLNKSANQERAMKLAQFLKLNGYKVKIIDSQKLFNKNKNNILIYGKFFFTSIVYQFIEYLIYKFKNTAFEPPYPLCLEMLFRGLILKRYLTKKHAGFVISQYPEDISIAYKPRTYKIILDLPTIYSEENQSRIIRKIEKKSFDQSDNVCFHWYSFLNLSKKINKEPKNNFILNWGCDYQKNIVTANKNPKILYLGNLNSSWIYPQLLENIQNKSPIPVDIYSYQNPDQKIYKSLKIKGYMKNLANISKYQFGLLTFTDDELRNNGFSAKHMLYLSYGLPVLCPEWRKDNLLKPATIYYNQENFSSQIQKFSQKKYWIKKHYAAIKISKKLNWNETLKPLLPIIYRLQTKL
jgi:glycerophosphoryl diester phosphodiesterase